MNHKVIIAAIAALALAATNAHAEWRMNNGDQIVDWVQEGTVTKFCLNEVYSEASAAGQAEASQAGFEHCLYLQGYSWFN